MAVKLIVGVNDLLTLNPSLASEWDYERNINAIPQQFSSGSSKKVWWIGKCGHSWAATIASRNSGVGCPICARYVISERVHQSAVRRKGSLAEKNPDKLKEWDYEKNTDCSPEDITSHSHKAVWWKCSSCGHEWKMSISTMVDGVGCPQCYKKNRNPQYFHRNNKIHQRIRTPLSVGNSAVSAEWHPTKNGNLTPEKISVGSHTKVWWLCENGHEWEASPNHRTSKTRNCPYCCANPRVLPGVNDLATLNPVLAEEWNYEKNAGLTPRQITASSSKSVWWKCSLGHEWKTAVNHRSDGSGCPKCAKGRQTSFPEQAIYYYVSKTYPDAINGYTEIFNNHGMELDVFIPSLNVGIEYDGIAFHRKVFQKKRDGLKYEKCKEKGIKLIRVKEDVENCNDQCCDALILLSGGLEAGITELNKYGIKVYDVNIQRDQNEIDAYYRNNLQEKSFWNKYPRIAEEWNYEKNDPLTPQMFAARSNRRVWWRCSQGHEWNASIDSRVRGTGCPFCSGNKVLEGYNDIASTRPDLLKEWDYEKNSDLNPTAVTSGSGKKVWWRCEKGHSWRAVIASRSKGHGCPYCSGYRKEF